ncbi:MAG TPA: AAA family ATPase [Miltoncostaeaceae bacterium]|nr:AAA family ATPase [Miltoncostaeaceae bacterium]
MRPLRLELVHFRSYDRETVDWTPYDLVVIGGDTGAGKTSLLDAIAFALYGRTPETTRSGDLLTLRTEHGEVRLTFALRDETWRVTRRYGPKAPDPARVLERLEDGPDGDAVQVIDQGVDEVLRRLLGLGFEAFTSAVLLAQGRFERFLGAQPRERDAILRELFAVAPLEGARLAAQRAQSAADGRALGLDHAIASLPAHAPTAWWGAARGAREAARRRAAVRALRPLAERADGARRRAADARERAAAAHDGAALLPDRAACDALVARLEGAEQVVAQAAAARERAVRDHEGALAARELLRLRHGATAADLSGLAVAAESLARLASAVPAQESAVAEAAAAEGAARGALAEAERAGAESAAAHATAVAARDRAAGLAAARRAVMEAAAVLAAADAALGEAARAHDTAMAAREDAQRAHESAVRHDHVVALRAGLAPGDACPVCGGTVGDHDAGEAAGDAVSLARALDGARGREREAAAARARAAAARERAEADHAAARSRAEEAGREAGGDAGADPAAALASAEDAVAAAEAALAEAREAYGAARGAVGTAEGAHRAAAARLAELRGEQIAARGRLGTWGALPDPAAALAAAREEVGAAEAAAEEAARVRQAAVEAEQAARTALAALETGELSRLRGAAARVATLTGLAAPGDDLPPAAFLAALSGLRDAAHAAAAAAREEAGAAEAGCEAAERALAARGAPFGVGGSADLPAALQAADAAARAARAGLAAVRATAGQAASLRRQAAGARAEAAVHAQVARDLQANGFPRFLLARFGERLAAGASVRLQELSHGAYRFAGGERDPLRVVDVRRNERTRPPSTLSGGERFLASLALALGLGDIAAESGGRLDCLFLDEGFSTLDADSLEQALAGVERLAGEGRLIAVITHLPGVAERLGASLRVAKDAAGVSRVVV